MKKIILILLLISANMTAQKSLKKLLKQYNTESVAYTYIDSIKANKGIILLDAREIQEYEVSHLKNAVCVGYDNFDIHKTTAQLNDKDATIVVYCSVGIRSEDIAEKLKAAGYNNVYNLYGGIFEWKNNGNTVYNKQEAATEKVHTFNKEWSKWLNKGEKVYD